MESPPPHTHTHICTITNDAEAADALPIQAHVLGVALTEAKAVPIAHKLLHSARITRAVAARKALRAAAEGQMQRHCGKCTTLNLTTLNLATLNLGT